MTIAQGIWNPDDLCLGLALATLLPDLHTGNWNDGQGSRFTETGEPHFARAIRTSFPGVSVQGVIPILIVWILERVGDFELAFTKSKIP